MKTKKILKRLLNFNFILIFFFLLFFVLKNITLAQNPPGLREQIKTNMSQAGTNAGYYVESAGTADEAATAALVGQIIAVILSFLGVVFLVIIIYSGFQWMTAGGNEETITKAKKRIVNSVIGLVIVFTAYLITYFITNVLIETTYYAF